ncbi:cytochrome P450 [Kitasatospora sp. NPDC093806]|uniref:cytochrome P450 family protein n=1 Tax=Kitasatospora sp. NPDC093806 TaxID=3155075 RepID=UPI00342CF039
MTHQHPEPPQLFGPEQVADPYPAYAELRAQAPVCPVKLPDGVETWFVTGYDQADRALAHPGLSKDPASVREMLRKAGSPFFTEEYDKFNAHMLNADPPEHTRLRQPVSRAFTPRRVEKVRPRVERLADELLAAMAAAGTAECDLLEAYARPLPLPVICELMGVPGADGDQVMEWSEALFSPPGTFPITPAEAGARLGEYVTGLVEGRQAALAAGTEDPEAAEDLIGQLIRNETLSHQELLSTVLLVLLTGHSSTSDLIGNAVVALLAHPEQLELFKSSPELTDAAVDELMRYDTSVFRATIRIAAEDVDLGSAVVPQGSLVGVVLGAANRDPERFPDPDRLDLTRTDRANLALGQGVHYCLGSALARLVAGVALRKLFTRFPDLALVGPADGQEWMNPGSGVGRALLRLPVLLEGKSA